MILQFKFLQKPLSWQKKLSLLFGLFYVFLFFLILFSSREAMIAFFKTERGLVEENAPEKNYARDCYINFFADKQRALHSLQEISWDGYVISHTLGHLGVALMVRNTAAAWIISVGFELIEISLQYQIPYFKECWYDHYIVDVLLCNALGITAAMKLCQLLGWKLFPNIVTRQILENPLQFGKVLVMVVVMLGYELNSFLYKYIFDIPLTHYFNLFRGAGWILFGFAGIQDYYEDVIDSQKDATDLWKVGITVSLLENLIVVKHFSATFSKPFPDYVKLPYALTTSCLLIWASLVYASKKFSNNHHRGLDVLFFSSFAPLVALMVYGI